jgi:hypothetical protein
LQHSRRQIAFSQYRRELQTRVAIELAAPKQLRWMSAADFVLSSVRLQHPKLAAASLSSRLPRQLQQQVLPQLQVLLRVAQNRRYR